MYCQHSFWLLRLSSGLIAIVSKLTKRNEGRFWVVDPWCGDVLHVAKEKQRPILPSVCFGRQHNILSTSFGRL